MSREALPVRPREERAQTLAKRALRVFGIKRLPVQPEALFAQMKDTAALLEYEEAKPLLRTGDPLHLASSGADARTLYIPSHGLYLTVYRRSLSPERDRFTLAHELGHILSGHLTDFDSTALAEGKTSAEADALEREADLFAACLLAPEAVVAPLVPPRGVLSAEQLGALCGLSREAARARMSALKSRHSPLPDTPELCPELFYSTWETPPDSIPCRVCSRCGTRVYDSAALFCPHCGKRTGGTGTPGKRRETPLPLFPDGPFCPAEKRPLPSDSAFCPYCGFPAEGNRRILRKEKFRDLLERDYGEEGRFSVFMGSAYLKALMRERGDRDAARALDGGRLMADRQGNLLMLCADAESAGIIASRCRRILDFAQRVTGKKGVIGLYVCAPLEERGRFPGLSGQEFTEIQTGIPQNTAV